MSHRDTILKSIRDIGLSEFTYPDSSLDAIEFDDKIKTFVNILESCGGKAVFQKSRNLADLINESFPDTDAVYSQVEEIKTTIQEDVDSFDLSIFNGQFAVAENAAIWLDIDNIKVQQNLFLCEYLCLIILLV